MDKKISDDVSEAIRIASPFARSKTTLFSIRNSKMNHFFVLAENRKDALTFLENKGHISNRNLARISEAKGSDWAVDMTKFFSSAAQASVNRAQGIVKNMDGFAVMQNGGGVFMPLSVVQP